MDQAWRYPFWPPYPGYFQPPVYGAGNNDQQSGPSHEEQNCDGSLLPRDQTYELDEEDFEEQYHYRVKIINTEKRSDFVIRELHSYQRRFDSILEIKMAIKNEFKDCVPSDNSFQVGYFLGKNSSKHWLVSPEDLRSMYSSLGSKRDIMLWCDRAKSHKHDSVDIGSKRPSTSNNPVSKRRETDDKVDETVAELKLRHDSKYTLPQMRLWARMIAANHHESLDDPPEIPAITGIVPKRKKRESVAEAITTLAGAIRNSPTPTGANTQDSDTTPDPKQPAVGYSPGKTSDLRMKNLQELRELQQLLEQRILTPEEFAEQKALVLTAMRKLVT